MSKPMGAWPPPRDLQESQEMLDRSRDWSEGWKDTAKIVGGALVVLAGVAGIAYWLLILTGFVRLF